ncbi:EpsG family protein, partial [Aliarcobacter thereius]|uniref:EpsG family protein n=1 Tax=Aliarcobacter thereius TaxID=544718 RepID=UPI001041DC2B
MIYYISFFVFINLYLILSNIYKSRIFLYPVLFFAFVFSALRYDAGYDYFSYLNIIITEEGLQRLEYFNRLIIELSNYLNFPQLYFIITSFLFILFMTLGFKQFKQFNYVTVYLMLFFIGSYITSFDIVRQMVSVSILFYAISLFINKGYFSSIIFFLIAVNFHKASLIFIPIVLFLIIINSKEFKTWLYIVLVFMSIYLIDIFIVLSEITGLYTHYFITG